MYTKEKLIELLTVYINKNGYPINKKKEFILKNGLPSYTTYSAVFGNDLANMIELCGFKLTDEEKYDMQYRGLKSNISKSQAIIIIENMQSRLNRPLIYDDFRNPTINSIGITEIKRIWGSMNKMKKELGLIINQESMIDRMKSREEMIEDMRIFIEQLGRLPTAKEIDRNKNMLNTVAYFNYFGGINNVFLSLGFIPKKKDISLHLTNKEIFEIYKEFTNDLEVTPTFEYCKKVYELPSPRTVTRRLKCSWNEFMEQLGFIPNSNHEKGTTCYAKDGTICFSIAECLVHNYFLDNNVNIISKEYLYRDLTEDNNLKSFIGYKRCDWILQYNDKFYIIEYFGLMGSYDYNKRHDKKIEFINKSNLQNNFIAIYPKDLHKLNDIFGFMINNINIYKEVS